MIDNSYCFLVTFPDNNISFQLEHCYSQDIEDENIWPLLQLDCSPKLTNYFGIDLDYDSVLIPLLNLISSLEDNKHIDIRCDAIKNYTVSVSSNVTVRFRNKVSSVKTTWVDIFETEEAIFHIGLLPELQDIKIHKNLINKIPFRLEIGTIYYERLDNLILRIVKGNITNITNVNLVKNKTTTTKDKINDLVKLIDLENLTEDKIVEKLQCSEEKAKEILEALTTRGKLGYSFTW